jgi:short-subunit dehydrogenase
MDLDLYYRDDFAKQYGPWAVVAGACEGIGAAFARRIAAHRINIFLIDDKPKPLVALSRSITAQSQVEVRAAPLDLAVATDLEQAKLLTAGLEIGLFVFDGADRAEHGPFLERPVEAALHTIRRNVIGPTTLCHLYGAQMCRRRRGGIIIVGSLHGCAGGAELAADSGAEAFEQIFSEGLWHELKPLGVDVVCCIGANTLSAQGHQDAAADPAIIAQEGLDHLKDGPTWFAGDHNRAAARRLCTPDRRAAAELMSSPEFRFRRVH